MKMPKAENGKMADAIRLKLKPKLPVNSDDAIIKYISAEDDNVVVIVAEREKVERHLAIYENADLCIKSIETWPTALVNCYTNFFGRRKSDINSVAMMLDIEAGRTNVVICRHKNLLFAHSILIGAEQLQCVVESAGGNLDDASNGMITKLVLELDACRRHFGSMYTNAQIEHMVFLSGNVVAKDICATIAQQLEMRAQIGDCLLAVEIDDWSNGGGIDRRSEQFCWATAFGLSLSCESTICEKIDTLIKR